MYRLYVANIPVNTAALCAQSAGMQGTAYAQYGFGPWGVEPGTTFEFGGASFEDVTLFAAYLLRKHGENTAYLATYTGEAWYVQADGRVEAATEVEVEHVR